MKYLLLFAIMLFFFFESHATPIVGGGLTYEHLGGSSYNVRLKLYRDCELGNDPYPDSVYVEVRTGLGNDLGLSFWMPRLGIVELDPPIDSCAVDPGICVEEALFSTIISLAPNAEGYHLFNQQFSRNGSINNLVDPENTGEGFHAYIPSNFQWLTNSSPSWVNFPPVFICQGQDVAFDHSATDADGDSLVYSLYKPYDGRRFGVDGDYNAFLPTINPTPNPPDNIQFPLVTYNVGFAENNPLNVSGTLLTIDSQTGMISGIPEDLGQFVVAVKCEEYRNGEKIGVIVRDFQFNVINCPPPQTAEIGPVNGCDGNEIAMINNSAAGAEDFFWDFGDGSAGSFADEPTYTYPGVGDYLITLIAQQGTICADTAYYNLVVGGVTGVMGDLDSTCINSNVNFQENSTTEGNMVIDTWQWDFGDGSPVSTVPNPSHVFNTSGDLIVELIIGTDAGCYDTISEPLFIQGLPNADVGPDTTACFNNPNINLSGIVVNASGGIWVGNGGVFNPNTTSLNANYDPSQSEIDNGFTEIILSTTGNGFCPSNQDVLRIDFIDGPEVDAGPDVEVCSDTSSIPLSASFQFAGGVEWYTNDGTGSFSNSTAANTTYIPSAADAQEDSLMIYVRTIINGNCFDRTDSLKVFFFNPPTISLVYPDTICSGNRVGFNSNSTTGNGIWSTSGDGTFDSDTSATTIYEHGASDLSNGSVAIYFESINNGGCQTQHDTVDIDVLPSPIIDYSFSDACFEEETSFTSTVTSVDPITEYSWSYDGIAFSADENPDFILPNIGAIDVTFIVNADNTCADTITKSVSTYYLPEVGFSTPAPCLYGGAQFFDESTLEEGVNVGWKWNFGDGDSSEDQDPLHHFEAVNNYDITLVVFTDQGCSDTLTELIEIYPGPNADFLANPGNANVFEGIDFTDQSESDFPIVFWEWMFGDGNFSNDQNTTHDYAEGGDYDVAFVVEDENGCLDTTSQVVNIYLPPLVPSGFSPNGDHQNDLLYVYGGPYETLEFKIYNNWGEVIFETNDISIGWDGKYKNEDLPVGVYVWTVRATTTDGAEHDLSGDTSLIR